MITEVQVLLAVNNGEKYLAELLASLTRQQECTIHLIVGFDNSDDTSELILQKFESSFKTVTIYKNNFGSHNKNFSFLFSKRLSGIPLAFCDQDDIWSPAKLQNSLDQLAKVVGPALATSTVRILKTNRIEPSKVLSSQVSAIFVNPSKGCTQVLNVELQELIERHGGLPTNNFYDWWVYIVGLFFGEVLYSYEPSIEYRLHQNNTIGQPSLIKHFKTYFYRIFNTGSLISQDSIEFLIKVRAISSNENIKLSANFCRLVFLLEGKKRHRLSIFKHELNVHPQGVKNFILKMGIILSPRIDPI